VQKKYVHESKVRVLKWRTCKNKLKKTEDKQNPRRESQKFAQVTGVCVCVCVCEGGEGGSGEGSGHVPKRTRFVDR
jgi:hypothetical protein